ncbi:MAG TPA: phage integrase family protein [Dehalococcoidia bacterium]|nr:phage integrase family protein [Dehalococcoidia bacterium]
MPSTTIIDASRLFVGGCIILTSFLVIRLKRCYHLEDRRDYYLPSAEQLDILLDNCLSERDKVILSLLWYSGMRLSEVANVKASDFDWDEGTVITLGKGNRYRKALAGNGLVREWFQNHDSLEMTEDGISTMLKRLGYTTGIHCNAHSFRRGFRVHNVKSGLSNKVIQALGGWESPSMVSHYAQSLTFEEALELYHKVNGRPIHKVN